jgi:hypothetical protein
MEIMIRLRPEWWKTLWNHVPAESPARYALTNPVGLEGIRNTPEECVVFSNKKGADAVLEVAKRHCPQAVTEIELEIHRAAVE